MTIRYFYKYMNLVIDMDKSIGYRTRVAVATVLITGVTYLAFPALCLGAETGYNQAPNQDTAGELDKQGGLENKTGKEMQKMGLEMFQPDSTVPADTQGEKRKSPKGSWLVPLLFLHP